MAQSLQSRGGETSEASPGLRRPDIQGLRAIAVLAVVAFHADLPVPGGFVGVDIFFVISGYVITNMLHREWSASGRIRFGHFYLRRFQRLTPALALMITVTMLLSLLILSPLGPQQVAAETALGAVFMVANGVIARTTGGYFDAPAEANPLLNTWSLSLEEQFYLVFPALLAFGWFVAKRRRSPLTPFLVVGVVAVTSFGLAVIGASGLNFRGSEAILGFYSPLTRAWEFACGALLALAILRRPLPPYRITAILGGLGLLAIAASLWGISDATPFPGLWTLLPVSGTLLLLLAGTRPENPTSRILSAKPFIKIGDWSYSIYLWHWPFIVFAVYLWPFVPWAPFAAAVLAMAPSLASYHFVEQPIRSSRLRGKRAIAALFSVTLTIPLFVSAAIYIAASHYWTPLYDAGVFPIANEGDTDWGDFYLYLEDTYFPCSNSKLRDGALEWDGITRCRQSKAGNQVDLAVVGDSHAEHLFLGLAEALPHTNVAFYILNASPVQDGGEMSRLIDEVAHDTNVRTVIVSAFWAGRDISAPQLADTLSKFASTGKNVYLTDGVPVYPFDARECKFGSSPFLSNVRCTQDYHHFMSTYSRYFPVLESAVLSVPEVELLYTARYFCDATVCSMTYRDRLMYRDTNHLNNIGSRYLVTRILEDYPALKMVSMRASGI